MLEPKQILQNRYELQHQLSNNAARQTWLAKDLEAIEGSENALVVVKLLAFGGTVQWDDLKLFEREAQILKQLDYPRIPKYIDYFSIDDRLLWFGLVQQYIPGESLKEQLTQGKRFSEKQVKKIAVEVLDILRNLHELNPAVLHRDIKPSNLICGTDNQIYLVDFGAVQDKAAKEGATFTVVGTYGYAPMEQFGGRAVPASDLYALGASIIHLLTGIAPADLPVEDLRIQFSEKTNISSSFKSWLEQITEPSVQRRFSSATQALEALKSNRLPNAILRSIGQPVSSLVQISKSAKELSIKLPRRSKSDIEVIGFTMMILFVSFIGITLMSGLSTLFFYAPLIALGLLLTLFLIWWSIIDSLLLSTWGHQRVVISKDFFAVELWLFKFCRNRRVGKTTDVQDVFQSVLRIGTKNPFQIESGEDKEMVTIQTGFKRYSFGVGLSAIECVWLAQEIKDWLRSNSLN
jgi:serine/threonine protein kinase